MGREGSKKVGWGGGIWLVLFALCDPFSCSAVRLPPLQIQCNLLLSLRVCVRRGVGMRGSEVRRMHDGKWEERNTNGGNGGKNVRMLEWKTAAGVYVGPHSLNVGVEDCWFEEQPYRSGAYVGTHSLKLLMWLGLASCHRQRTAKSLFLCIDFVVYIDGSAMRPYISYSEISRKSLTELWSKHYTKFSEFVVPMTLI
jgi:hypothetical protein